MSFNRRAGWASVLCADEGGGFVQFAAFQRSPQPYLKGRCPFQFLRSRRDQSLVLVWCQFWLQFDAAACRRPFPRWSWFSISCSFLQSTAAWLGRIMSPLRKLLPTPQALASAVDAVVVVPRECPWRMAQRRRVRMIWRALSLFLVEVVSSRGRRLR